MERFKVKRKSWHYTLYCLSRQLQSSSDGPFEAWELLRGRSELRRTYQPSSLCRYFWFTLGSCFIWPFIFAFFILLLAAAGIILVLTYPLIWYYDRRKDKRLLAGGKSTRQPSMIAEFIRAKKNKVCKLIEVVDE